MALDEGAPLPASPAPGIWPSPDLPPCEMLPVTLPPGGHRRSDDRGSLRCLSIPHPT